MSLRPMILAALGSLSLVQPVWALDGQILITQAKALAGNVTPGDAPGFPVTLTRTGSYKLASNLDLPVGGGVNGIEANAVEITIDLNGFRIDGKGRTTAGDCVVGNQRNLTVRNGTIMRCLNGIKFQGGNIATDLRITENTYGIYIINTSATIRSNAIVANVHGVFCDTASGGCLVENNLIRGIGATGTGVTTGSRSTLIGNQITDSNIGVFIAVAPGAPLPALGNNNIAGNSTRAISGAYQPLHPNSCESAAC